MPRHADFDWNLPEGTPAQGGGRSHQWESIHAALLMDIRAELRRVRAALECHNAQAIPRILREIQRNTKKRKYVRQKK